MKTINKVLMMGLAAICLLSSSVWPNQSEFSVFDRELHKLKYDYTYLAQASAGQNELAMSDDSGTIPSKTSIQPGYKSPTKAFLLSLAVPGLGQYYYGSRVKPIAFLGIEATAWILNVSWHNKGQQLTHDFQAFNDAHWSQTSYEDYLEAVYGVRDDDSVTATEASHNLPDTKTQQYYEMTGKYSQFAWGWDDAILNGQTHADFNPSGVPPFPPAITSASATPYSARRFNYETQRNNANNKLNDANKMIMVALANHVIAAVEAFITTKSRNGNAAKSSDDFSHWKVKPSLRSIYSKRDTPYVKVTYKF